jgi:uncharacterized protein (TIGR02611 family)
MTGAEAPPGTAEKHGRVGALRARVRALPGGRLAWRIGVTIAGVAVIVIGIILLPLPGPGWLIIFAGLGILATEYEWAARLLSWARAHVRRWTQWIAAKPLWVRVILGVVTFIVVAAIVVAAWIVPRRWL